MKPTRVELIPSDLLTLIDNLVLTTDGEKEQQLRVEMSCKIHLLHLSLSYTTNTTILKLF